MIPPHHYFPNMACAHHQSDRWSPVRRDADEVSELGTAFLLAYLLMRSAFSDGPSHHVGAWRPARPGWPFGRRAVDYDVLGDLEMAG
jgi:hypothetical protein